MTAPRYAPSPGRLLRPFVALLVFAGLVAEQRGEIFAGQACTFMAYLGDVLFAPVPVLRSSTYLTLWLLAFAFCAGWRTVGRVRPLQGCIALALATVAAGMAWGLVRGGDLKLSLFQLQWFIMTFVVALAIAGVFRTPRHFGLLWKSVLAAALWRAGVAVYLCWVFVRTGRVNPPPAYMTSHHDSVLFVAAVLLLISHGLERRSGFTWVRIAPAIVLVLMAIQYNGRRLAYVGLVAGLAVLYMILPRGPLRRRINRTALLTAPVALLYVAVGWGREEAIFKPIYAFSSQVGETTNASTETREIENYNLVLTLRSNVVLGRGWGRPYDEVSVAYDISHLFPWYRWVPHNWMLGLLAFAGVLGFTVIWLVFPSTVFLMTLVYRAGRSPGERTIAAASASVVIVYLLQMMGDMGLGSTTAGLIMGAAMAGALRLPAAGTAWRSAVGTAA
jgi:hypothetical protein